MSMKNMPQIISFTDGSKLWENKFEKFSAIVYLPDCDLPVDVINYGFMTPYLLIFGEQKYTNEEAKQFADSTGLSQIAKRYGGSVVFIYPENEAGWKNAPENLFASVISESKIGQYYQDGVLRTRDRFTGKWGEYYIRGALNRSYLYGFGESADYIVKNCLKTIEGDGLYGKGDITPVVCILQNVKEMPELQRRDIPVISIGNSKEVNDALAEGLDRVLIKDEVNYVEDFDGFIKKYRRMVGGLNIEPDLEAMGMVVEPGYCEVSTTSDNRGDDKDTGAHKIGYVAYYNKKIMTKQNKLPLVMCFHGGGDSAMCMVALSDWHLVANKYDFLLVSVENHLNSTATEAIALIEHLKDKYPVDDTRIYSTGFSMGGCKTWDMFQEYPKVFAAVAPMDATFEVGLNVYGQPAPKEINREVVLPVFYVGGEDTPLPELPFQEIKCLNRMKNVLEVNQAITQNGVQFEEQDKWKNPIWGIDGDWVCKAKDDITGSVLTMQLFQSKNGCCYSVFASASKQSHEMRHLNCENAWKFMSRFQRMPDGKIRGGEWESIKKVLAEKVEGV